MAKDLEAAIREQEAKAKDDADGSGDSEEESDEEEEGDEEGDEERSGSEGGDDEPLVIGDRIVNTEAGLEKLTINDGT